MYPTNKEDYQYNQAAESSYKREMYLLQMAQKYGEFCALCERENIKLITFDDFMKLYPLEG